MFITSNPRIKLSSPDNKRSNTSDNKAPKRIDHDRVIPLELDPEASLGSTNQEQRSDSAPVVHIKQSHSRPGDSEERQKQVARSQQLVLDALMAGGFRAVFAENQCEVGREGRIASGWRQAIAMCFKDYRPDQELTEFQASLLYELEAPVVYAVLAGDVQLLPTTTKEHLAQTDAYIDQNSVRFGLFGFSRDDKRVIFMEREQLASRFIRDWREQNPGEVAALVYGSEHDFERHQDELGAEVLVVEAQAQDQSSGRSRMGMLDLDPNPWDDLMKIRSGLALSGAPATPRTESQRSTALTERVVTSKSPRSREQTLKMADDLAEEGAKSNGMVEVFVDGGDGQESIPVHLRRIINNEHGARAIFDCPLGVFNRCDFVGGLGAEKTSNKTAGRSLS